MERDHIPALDSSESVKRDYYALSETVDPQLLFGIMRHKKRFILRLASICALLLFLVSLYQRPFQAEAMIRLEKTIVGSQGEEIVPEVEADVLSSRTLIQKVLENHPIDVRVSQIKIAPLVPFKVIWERLVSRIKQVDPDLRITQPTPAISYFKADKKYEHQKLILTVLDSSRYSLRIKGGDILFDADAGKLTSAKGIQMQADYLQAIPGTQFRLIPLSAYDMAAFIEQSLDVEPAGVDKLSGLVSVDYSDADPFFVRQFTNALVKQYLANTMTRTIGHRMVTLEAEAETHLKHLNEIDTQILAARSKLEQASSIYTDDHPLVISLKAQLAQLESEYQQRSKETPTLSELDSQLIANSGGIKHNGFSTVHPVENFAALDHDAELVYALFLKKMALLTLIGFVFGASLGSVIVLVRQIGRVTPPLQPPHEQQ